MVEVFRAYKATRKVQLISLHVKTKQINYGSDI